MKVNKKTITVYSSVQLTKVEQDFCKELFEMAHGIAKELDTDAMVELYEIIRILVDGKGYIDFDDFR